VAEFLPQSGGKARCDISKSLLSYAGGTTLNLAKRLKATHPSIVDDIQPKKNDRENPAKARPRL